MLEKLSQERNNQYFFDVGSRVDVNWDEMTHVEDNVRWVKAFVCRKLDDDMYEVIRDADLAKKFFHIKFIKSLAMDVEGFHLAAGHGYQNVIRNWIEIGGDPNAKFKGFTALHLACETGQLESIRYLVEEAGANPRLKHEQYGVRPFEVAFLSGRLPVIKYILQHIARREGGRVVTPAQNLSSSFSAAIPGFGLDRVLLLPTSWLLMRRQNCFPSYEVCVQSGLHVRGTAVHPEDRVLYICHSSGQRAEPDKEELQFQAVKSFIRKAGEDHRIKYIFYDYSCINQAADSKERLGQLQNLNLALMLCTDCLMLPKISMKTADENNQKEDVEFWVSDLNDLLKNGWCKYELVACIATGVRLFCHYFLSGHIDQVVEVAENLQTSDLPVATEGRFCLATTTRALNLIGERSMKHRCHLAEKVAALCWAAESHTSPYSTLKSSVIAVLSLQKDNKLGDVCSFTLLPSEMRNRTYTDGNDEFNLANLAYSFGIFSVERERITALCNLLQLLAFCMDCCPIYPQQPRGPRSFGENLATVTSISSDVAAQSKKLYLDTVAFAHFPGTSAEPNCSLPTGHGGKPTEKRDSSTLRLVPSSISLRKLKAMYVSDHQFNEESRVLCTDLKFFVQDEAGNSASSQHTVFVSIASILDSSPFCRIPQLYGADHFGKVSGIPVKKGKMYAFPVLKLRPNSKAPNGTYRLIFEMKGSQPVVVTFQFKSEGEPSVLPLEDSKQKLQHLSATNKPRNKLSRILCTEVVFQAVDSGGEPVAISKPVYVSISRSESESPRCAPENLPQLFTADKFGKIAGKISKDRKTCGFVLLSLKPKSGSVPGTFLLVFELSGRPFLRVPFEFVNEKLDRMVPNAKTEKKFMNICVSDFHDQARTLGIDLQIDALGSKGQPVALDGPITARVPSNTKGSSENVFLRGCDKSGKVVGQFCNEGKSCSFSCLALHPDFTGQTGMYVLLFETEGAAPLKFPFEFFSEKDQQGKAKGRISLSSKDSNNEGKGKGVGGWFQQMFQKK